MPYCIVFTTAGSQDEANKIAGALLESRTVSCVQMAPIKSSYHWKGKVENADEIHLTVKTKDELYSEVERIIKANHSYEVPQIVKVAITGGLPSYLDWIEAETK